MAEATDKDDPRYAECQFAAGILSENLGDADAIKSVLSGGAHARALGAWDPRSRFLCVVPFAAADTKWEASE